MDHPVMEKTKETSTLHLRVAWYLKSDWVRHANRQGLRLTQWVIRSLNTVMRQEKAAGGGK